MIIQTLELSGINLNIVEYKFDYEKRKESGNDRY